VASVKYNVSRLYVGIDKRVAAFLARHPAVRTVFFNGTKAWVLWARHVAPALPTGLEPGLATLPSTSPVNAALTFADKLAAWQAVRDAAGDG